MNVEHVRELISADQLAERVARLGEQIMLDYAGECPVVVGVLTGCSIFLADLVRSMDLPLEVDFVAVSSYGDDRASSGEVRVIKDVSHPLQGRHVLLVEDIVDTGLTLERLLRLIKAREPKSLKVCALLDKPSRRRIDISADYVGFTVEDRFVVGYGLDAAGLYRNLPFVGELEAPE